MQHQTGQTYATKLSMNTTPARTRTRERETRGRLRSEEASQQEERSDFRGVR